MHKDDIWEAREHEELLRKMEREKEAQRFKTPTFEQLHRQQMAEDLKRAREMLFMSIFVGTAFLLGFVIIFAPSVGRTPPSGSQRER